MLGNCSVRVSEAQGIYYILNDLWYLHAHFIIITILVTLIIYLIYFSHVNTLQNQKPYIELSRR